MKKYSILVFLGLVMELLYISYRLIPTGPANTVIKYMAVFALAYILLGVSYFKTRSLELDGKLLVPVILLALLFQVTLLPAPPEMSDDIYRYIWDGKLQHFGISPFEYAPDDPKLRDYHSDILPGRVNFPHIKTIYPPAAQLLFRLSYALFGEGVTGMKFLFMLFQLGCTAIFFLILKLGRPEEALESKFYTPLLVFFAWNPLLIMETSINGHLDILMVFFLLSCFYFFIRDWPILAGCALALAVLSKLIPVILLPLFLSIFIQKKHIFSGLSRFFLPFTVTVAAFYAPYFYTAQNMFLTALNYSSKWYFNNPFFLGILAITRDNPLAHLVSFSIFVLVYLVILSRSWAWQKKAFALFLAFILGNPTIHPWYLILLLGLLCIHPARVALLWPGLVVLSYLVVYEFKLSGVWQDSWPAMLIQYLSLATLLFLKKPVLSSKCSLPGK